MKLYEFCLRCQDRKRNMRSAGTCKILIYRDRYKDSYFPLPFIPKISGSARPARHLAGSAVSSNTSACHAILPYSKKRGVAPAGSR